MIPNIENINVNSFERYIEPLVGAGKTLLSFNPSISCFLNEPEADSYKFFKNIDNPDLVKELELISNNWHLLKAFCNISVGEIYMVYSDFCNGIISADDINFMIRAILMVNMEDDSYHSLIGKNFAVSFDMLSNSWVQCIENTIIKLKSDGVLSAEKPDNEFKNKIEVSLKKGLFKHLVNLINLQNTGLIECLEDNKRLATLYFLKCCSKEKQLIFDKESNLKIQFDSNNNCSNNFTNCYKMFFNGNISKLNIRSIENMSIAEFIKSINPTRNDVVVINTLNRQLSDKRNSISKLILMELFQNYISNYVIVTGDSSFANEITKTEGFSSQESESYYIIKNF